MRQSGHGVMFGLAAVLFGLACPQFFFAAFSLDGAWGICFFSGLLVGWTVEMDFGETFTFVLSTVLLRRMGLR